MQRPLDVVDARVDLGAHLRWVFLQLLMRAPVEEKPTTLVVFFQLVEGVTPVEMAARLHCSRTTVWRRVRRIRRLWRQYDTA